MFEINGTWLKLISAVSPYSWSTEKFINSSLPCNTIRRHTTVSTLPQAMDCCLTAPSLYLNQYWFIIKGVLWHSPESNFTSLVVVIAVQSDGNKPSPEPMLTKKCTWTASVTCVLMSPFKITGTQTHFPEPNELRYDSVPRRFSDKVMSYYVVISILNMMTLSNGNNLRATGHLCREFTGHRCVPSGNVGGFTYKCWAVSGH